MSTSHKYLMNKVVLNPNQTIVRREKGVFSHAILLAICMHLSESLLPICSDISQSISRQLCIQIADIWSRF
jgi:hypothetical protein